MPRPTGQCPLCLEEKLLEDSHFIPRGLYDYCRGSDGGEPIKVTTDYALPTSRQTHDYVFCGACEDLLNERGEAWVVPKLARWDRSFPLFDLIRSAPALMAEDDFAVYAGAQNPKLDMDKIGHFIMGIYWKASIHSWSGSSDQPRIQLGPYSEEIRRYLLGAPFPVSVALTVAVSPPEVAYVGFNEPYEGVREPNYRNFTMCVPGLWMMLSVGKLLTPEVRTLSVGGPDGLLLISRSIAAKGQEVAFHVFARARKTKPFHEAMKRVRAYREKQDEGN